MVAGPSAPGAFSLAGRPAQRVHFARALQEERAVELGRGSHPGFAHAVVLARRQKGRLAAGEVQIDQQGLVAKVVEHLFHRALAAHAGGVAAAYARPVDLGDVGDEGESDVGRSEHLAQVEAHGVGAPARRGFRVLGEMEVVRPNRGLEIRVPELA